MLLSITPADATCLSRYGKTSYKELENARDFLFFLNSEIMGIILNAVLKKEGSYYYYKC